LDKHLEHLENHKNDLKRDHVYGRYAYVTYEDLEYLNKNRLLKSNESDNEDSELANDQDDDIEGESKEMILAIRAPYGSTLEIPCEA
jgi:hypothetical protein